MTVAAMDKNSTALSEVNFFQLENQLSNIIASAKQISIIAEELLREFSAVDMAGTADAMAPARLRKGIQAAAVAPRLLAATQQQLDSLNSMLHMD